MNLFPDIALLLFAYLLGAIPFGYILTRKYLGKNIMELGSGNIGSTNVEPLASNWRQEPSAHITRKGGLVSA